MRGTDAHLENVTDRGDSPQITEAKLPNVPGCYILVSDRRAMRELGSEFEGEFAALYVGKAEDSIHRRVAKTHLLWDLCTWIDALIVLRVSV